MQWKTMSAVIFAIDVKDAGDVKHNKAFENWRGFSLQFSIILQNHFIKL